MRPRRVVINLLWAGRLLAWSALLATTLTLALLLQTLAAGAIVEPGPSDPPAAGPSSAAVVEGDEASPPGHTRYTFGPNSYCSLMVPRWCGTEFAGAQGVSAGINPATNPQSRGSCESLSVGQQNVRLNRLILAEAIVSCTP